MLITSMLFCRANERHSVIAPRRNNMYILAVLIILLAAYYIYQKRIYSKWTDLNIPGPKPVFLFGNVQKFAMLRCSLTTIYTEIYRKFKGHKYVGIFLMNRPAILIRDPNLIEEVLVKKFSHFHDNDIDVKKDVDPVFGRNPFVAKGEDWKTTRTQHLMGLTGFKVKAMFEEINAASDGMVKFLSEKIDKNEGTFCMDALELMARYTTDVITSCTMGLDAKSFKSENPELRNAGKTIFEPDKLTGIKVLTLFVMPWLTSIFPIKLINSSLRNTYRKMIEDVLKYREDNNIVRNDFFEGTKEFRGKKMDIDDMVTLVGGVYIDGFGTNSSALNFMLYELAENVEVQAKLREEIKRYLEECDGKITFEGVQSLEFLDAVIHESLRKYPPFPQLTKLCTNEFLLPKSTESSSELKIGVGLSVVIPVYSLHNDENYFPAPQVFNPERFLSGNREKITKYTYMPFGDGPRACIGQKFALLQSKMALLKLIANFELRVNHSKTKSPIELDPFGLILAAKGRIWIDYRKL